ncbi:probable serine/threonine-protein kinase pats1 [Dreissena polymorpha]|nr:probable serine/threonine-protein kinase pats1 [Dreissena polymorpha]
MKLLVTSTEDHGFFKGRIALHKGDTILQEGIKVAKEMLETTSDNSEKSKASLDQSKNEITVSVWDFAGQSLYYSTHQFFLNERSIYVVVMDMTRSLKDVLSKSDGIGICCGLVDSCTYLDVFKFWLNAIHMNSDYQSGERTIQPTVILVGTRKDEMKGSAEEKEKNMNLYFDNALCSFDKNSPIFNHIYKNRFLVNNLSPKDSAFAELRKEIISLAAKQDYWDKEYPVRWIHMEQTLDKMRDEKRQIVKMKDVENEDLENIHPLGKEELTSFLELQHKQGNIIFFNSGELKDFVVLAPQWIIEAFKCFIPHNHKIEATVLKDWEEYKKYAILKPNVLDEVMKNSPP